MATNFYQKNKSKQKVLHYPTEIRSRFYQLVSSGNLQEVEAFLEKKDFRKLCDNNVLSETSVQNMRYHFIVTVTMLTHFCIQAGMPEVQAFDIQDNYIQSADQTHRLVDMEALHDEACMEYTLKMKRLQKQDISSKHITICINYIHQNIRKKLSVPDIAEYLQLHPSYLSKLFQEQMGCSIHSYILMQKMEEAKNLLRYTDYPCRSIAASLAFSSQSHFIQLFQKYTHLTPKQYRNQQSRNNMIAEPEEIES